MNFMTIVLLLMLSGAAPLIVAPAAAAEKPKDFAFGIPLTVDSDNAFYRTSLPAAFYTGSGRPDQGDLRVFNGDGAAVPYARLPSPDAVREKKPPATLAFFPLRVDDQVADLSGLSLTINRSAGKTSVNLTTREGQPVPEQRLAGYLVDVADVREPLSGIVLSWGEDRWG